jgi:hypothetical protein
MKKQIKNIAFVVLATLTLVSCSNDDNNNSQIPATATEFASIRQTALDNLTQSFQFNAEEGLHIFTTAKGVQFKIDGSCLTLGGNPVTGQVDIKYVEIFDGGDMITTDKTTMGQLPNGDMAMLVSGGEFYINATKNGQQLDITCPMQLIIPATLTGGLDPQMTLWTGTKDDEGNTDWEEQDQNPAGTQGGVFGEGQGANAAYFAFLNDFGWTNVDRFYSDPNPKTMILAGAPTGYNFQNSAIYLHYDGLGSSLAKLDTYNSTTSLFSEHYGQIPIGMAVHIIFVTEDNGQFRYAIKAVTITADAVYNFTLPETTVGSQAQLTAAINALP